MCTVTLIARRTGYRLGMNRDEKLTRVTACPPEVRRLGTRKVMFPSEPTGGTWVGVNDAGVTLALINWYSIQALPSKPAVSRGDIVRSVLPAEDSSCVEDQLSRAPLHRVSPFRLIGVFPHRQQVIEWRWNLKELDRQPHSWRNNTWISSGYDEPGAERTRRKVFRQANHQRTSGQADWLRRLHRSHRPLRGAYSHCMHREDAITVSFTEIAVTPQTAQLRYIAGAPCCHSFGKTLRLPLRP